MLLQIQLMLRPSWTGVHCVLKTKSHERGPRVIPNTSGGETEAQGERKSPQERGSGMPALGPDFPKPGRLLVPQIGSFRFVPCTMLPFRTCWLG